MITPEQEEELTRIVLADGRASPNYCALDRGAHVDSYSGSLTAWFTDRFPGTTYLDSEGVMNGWDSAAADIEMAFVFRANAGNPDFEAGRVIGKRLYNLVFLKTETEVAGV